MPTVTHPFSPLFGDVLLNHLKIEITSDSYIVETNLFNDTWFGTNYDKNNNVWCAIYKKNENFRDIIFGATFDTINEINRKIVFKISKTYKFDESFKDAYFTAFGEMIKSHKCIVLSDDTISPSAVTSWKKILKSSNLESKGYKPFIYDETNKVELTNYGSIDDLFGKTEKHGEILVGLTSIK